MKSKKLLALTRVTAFLAACGGEDGGSSGTTTPPPVATDLTLSDTAATGNAKCQTGTATTSADGSYSLLVPGGKLHCVLQITNPADGTKLHTVATGSSVSATANITPFTEMLVTSVLRNEPAVFLPPLILQ